MKTYFFNESFIPAGDSRFFLLAEIIISSKIYLALMKDFLEKLFPLDPRKTSRSHWKIDKKMVPTSQKITCPLARTSSFFENCFPLIQIMARSDQKTLFLLDKKSVSTRRMKDCFKHAFPLYGKVASTSKNIKIAENIKKLMFTSRSIFCLKKWTSPKFH